MNNQDSKLKQNIEKTSREYAEKLAIKMLKLNWEHIYDGDELFCEPAFFKNEKERIIEGYLKAVEETNVKELREALGELVYELTGDQEDEQELEKGLGITLAMRVARAINALNKTKS